MDTPITNEAIVKRGSLPGKNVVVIAGVHGNETCGIEAFRQLLPTLSLECGTATFLFGNPEAIKKNVRFVESNLNRLFRDREDLTVAEYSSLEYQRALELMPVLANADALLDIHSSGTKGSTPFAICEPESFSVTERLPFTIISSGWDAVEPGGTDYFVNKSGGLGITIECGFHDDFDAIERAKAAIYAFLAAMGLIKEKKNVSAADKRYIEVYDLYKTQVDFQPAREFSDFESMQAGELIGIDGNSEIIATEDCLVVFVRNRNGPGEEAFILGRELNLFTIKIQRS
jgi:succinylglutamate desuccinylase